MFSDKKETTEQKSLLDIYRESQTRTYDDFKRYEEDRLKQLNDSVHGTPLLDIYRKC